MVSFWDSSIVQGLNLEKLKINQDDYIYIFSKVIWWIFLVVKESFFVLDLMRVYINDVIKKDF